MSKTTPKGPNNKKCWSFDEIQALIQLVRQNPCLYDRKNPEYNQGHSKEDTWKRISQSPEIIEKHPNECKKKWKTLRIQQRRLIIQKIKKKDSNSTVHWNCYDALRFLIPHMDWTTSEEQTIKIEADIAKNCIKSTNGEVDDIDANNTDDYSICSDTAQEMTEVAVDNVNNSKESDQTMPIDKPQHLNQFVLTYMPAISNQSQFQNYSEHESCSQLVKNPPSCSLSQNQSIATVSQPQELISSTHKENSLATTQSSQIFDPDYGKTALTTSPALSYFLMDVAVQMEKLNEIAQMEVKIDIHKLLLDKLRNSNNLRN